MLRLLLLASVLLASTSHAQQAAATSPVPTVAVSLPTDGNTAGHHFIASNESVELVFRALGTQIGKPIQLSRQARRSRVTGDFNLAEPFEVIERIASTLGLVWYFDGHSVYVYDGSEMASTVLSLSPDAMDALTDFLKVNALYDKRFPLRAASRGLVYVSGPPKYLDIIRSSLKLIRTPAALEDGGLTVDVVKVRHVFVDDRQYDQREGTRLIPGLARVLGGILGESAVVRVAPAAPEPAAVAQPDDANGPPLAPLPEGIQELPPLKDDTHIDGHLLRIVAYPANNSLLLRGTPGEIASAKRLIGRLDEPKRQVELSLWVIDVARDNVDALGVQWSADARLGSGSVRFNRAASLGSKLGPAETARFIASVTALSALHKARIVSRPILLAQDNSPAVFDNNRTFYVKLKGERSVALEKVTYGTLVNVVPRILAADGPIEMDLQIEDGNSTAPTEESKLDLPVVSRTQIRTMARVLGDQSLLVGGYTHEETSSSTSKIPLLGDLPFIGGLFRYRTDKDDQSVRLFLIQPRLLSDDPTFDPSLLEQPAYIDDAVQALKRQMEARRV